MLVILGDILQGANTEAQLALGNFAPEPVSVVDLFAGAMLPGLLLVGLYLGWQILVAVLRPQASPALITGARPQGLPRRVLVALLPPAVLILAVLGSILAGIATPTESAAVGALGALLLAALRGRLGLEVLGDVVRRTMMITSMVFVILLGASVFALVFRGLGGDRMVEDALLALPGGPSARCSRSWR